MNKLPQLFIRLLISTNVNLPRQFSFYFSPFFLFPAYSQTIHTGDFLCISIPGWKMTLSTESVCFFCLNFIFTFCLIYCIGSLLYPPLLLFLPLLSCCHFPYCCHKILYDLSSQVVPFVITCCCQNLMS